MLTAEQCFCNINSAPVRFIRGRVELYEGSTLQNTFKYTDRLKSFKIERVGENSKFYGFGIVHRLNVHLIDKNRELNITTANCMDVSFGVGCDYFYAFPHFTVSEVHRNETTNELSITAYDALYKAANHTVNELSMPAAYTIETLAAAIANRLGVALNIGADGFDLYYEAGANLDGTETLRDVLNAIAEATQTIYYLNNDMALTFKRLDKGGAAVLDITKEKYFELDSGDNRRLAAIVSATELGDNVIASSTYQGTTQYMRDNPLLEMREDVDSVLDSCLKKVAGLTINQFDCKWRGNFLLEIGDKISLTTKDNAKVYSYVLDDVLEYDGSMRQTTKWQYETSEAESLDNPTTLGAALKSTYAKVDKANKQIEIVAGLSEANKDNLAAIRLDTESISTTVSRIEETTTSFIDGVNTELATLTQSVEQSVKKDELSILIKEELKNGVDSVMTSTGYTFNADGLSISKTGSEMESLLNEDGLTVYRDRTAVLTADNTGVNGINMTVRQYLIIGGSRFEDYNGRTGCFWIG